MQQEAVIGGITEPSGSRKYFVYDRGKLRYVGHTGTGFSKNLSENAQASLRTMRCIIAILIQASLVRGQIS